METTAYRSEDDIFLSIVDSSNDLVNSMVSLSLVEKEKESKGYTLFVADRESPF